MNNIQKKVIIETEKEKAFGIFLKELGNWWPKEYTWSQDQLVALKVNPTINGFFTEIGPYGFQCDWGRITKINNYSVTFYWQISPNRVPEPNPERSSEVEISFNSENDYTIILLEHRDFSKHGVDGKMYEDMMKSPEGWDYILAAFVAYLLK